MRKLVFGSIMAASLCSFAAFADQLSGYISESHCGTAHSSPSAANTACIKKCLGGGSDPVLVSDGKVMKFDAASKEKAVALAGKNVTVDGHRRWGHYQSKLDRRSQGKQVTETSN